MLEKKRYKFLSQHRNFSDEENFDDSDDSDEKNWEHNFFLSLGL